MSRIHDIGGMEGFGAAAPADDETFHADWEARVFALNTALVGAGVYELDEFRDAVERLDPSVYLMTSSYYERWVPAIEELLARKGVSSGGSTARRSTASSTASPPRTTGPASWPEPGPPT
ncbi:MAG: hypothetical protein ACR2FQ_12780, partial [Pseudonocardiaceae bacterium]